MNDKDQNQEQNQTPQPVSKNSVIVDVLSQPTHEELTFEKHPYEKEIDLNELFPDAETNLNDLFPDLEVKHLLRDITKNKKDMSTIKERLAVENETLNEDKEGELKDGDSSVS